MITTLEDVKLVLSENLDLSSVNLNSVSADAPLFQELKLDSLDAIEISVVLRKYYDIVIDNMEQARGAFATLETLRKYIEDNRKK
ncbi:MAG: phosphopantetheine-binding protein [Elusimicrobiota bacterium]|jgi:acyl carrier protein|nr:phosphopantetheine-binding protein [Elusimicrobiota bacterium]